MTPLEYCIEHKLFMPGDKIRAKTFSDIASELVTKGYKIDRNYDYNGRVERIEATHKDYSSIEISLNDSRKLREWQTISAVTGKPTGLRYFQRKGSYDRKIRLPIDCYEIIFTSNSTPEQRYAKYGLPITDIRMSKPETKSTKETTSKQKEPAMKMNFDAQDILDQNKEAALTAAKIEVGEAAVEQLVKIIKPQLPMMVRGYADLPLFDILVANLVIMAIRQYAPKNEKALVVADAMLMAAMQKQMKEFNIPGMINDFVAKVDVSSITGPTE